MDFYSYFARDDFVHFARYTSSAIEDILTLPTKYIFDGKVSISCLFLISLDVFS